MLQEFQVELEKLIGKKTELRPFVCEGSPLVGVMAVSHLSRGWSEKRAREIGQILGSACVIKG